MFWRKKAFDRTEILGAADQARARGQTKKAIALYRRVLEEVPNDLAVLAKIAPLLARRKKKDQALASFTAAAGGQVKAGFDDRALSLLLQAAEFYPEEFELWDEIARIHVQRGRRADAVAALADGARRLQRGPLLPIAARVLKRALEIEPWHPKATMLLARVLARGGRRDDALVLLDGLAARARGKMLRRTLRLSFRLSPTPGNLWRWLKSGFGGR